MKNMDVTVKYDPDEQLVSIEGARWWNAGHIFFVERVDPWSKEAAQKAVREYMEKLLEEVNGEGSVL
jgi:hypothetical protein